MLVKQYPCAFVRDDMQCKMKLIVTVTTQRMEYVPSRALRVDADYGRRVMNIAKHKGQSALYFTCSIQTFKAQQAEMGPARWKTDICDLS